MKMISKLPQLMESKGLDQKTLAFKTGLSPTTVGKIYRSQFNQIDSHTVTTLCRYFKLKTISDLIDIQWEKNDVKGLNKEKTLQN